MVGRNDPCLCGSGKKYKKCCALKNELSSETLIEEELDRILLTFYGSALDSPADMVELERYERKWTGKLGGVMEAEEIGQSVIEYFLFVARRDLWKRYLVKVLNGPIRSAIRSMLEAWQNPIVLFGKVKDIEENHFIVDEILGQQTYRIAHSKEMKVEKDILIFGVVLPDNRTHENGLHVLDGLTFIYDRNGSFAQSIVSMAETSEADNSYEFFKTHMLDIYKAILQREVTGVDDLVENQLLPEQQEVMVILEDALKRHALSTEILEFTKMIAITYLLKKRVVYRKPEIIAAAVFKTAYDHGLFGDAVYSQADVAKMFGVSVGSMMKHVDMLYDVVTELTDSMNNHGGPNSAYWVGTDPRMTERANWEMHCKMSTLDFETFEEAQSFLKETMNAPFTPSGQKQEAQVIAYDAYDAENTEERYRLAKKAYALDAKNVDAILLQAELATVEKDAERFFQSAIKIGEGQFDAEPEIAWGLVTNRPYMRAIFAYGVWLYEREQFGKAAELFKKLLTINPTDNQGARYIAISAFAYNGNLPAAKRVLEEYKVGTENDAPYLFMKWMIERDSVVEETDSEVLLEALNVNPFIIQFLDDEAPRLPYPTHVSILPGSMEEAQYIWWLL